MQWGWVGLAGLIVMGPLPSAQAGGQGVFQAFVGHVSRQILQDKHDFVTAQLCTEWFYQQLQEPSDQEAPPTRHNVVNSRVIQGNAPDELGCRTTYPQGLEEARADFVETQAYLSLSLTFYQLVLVSDRNDDDVYDPTELRDMGESIGLRFLKNQAPFEYVMSLTARFDSLREAKAFTVLTDGLTMLFEKGYRLTHADEAALHRVSE
ncbi:MAG: hypothetical protein D6704_11555 [Nitrospirae bacterium]|nr:MAG: hypothetical protein D6704_11555 [Nitrospirota bacterium]